MYENETVLCAASAYKQQYFLDPQFDKLPDAVKSRLKIFCVQFTEEVGGIIVIGFDPDGALFFDVSSEDTDLMYDKIESTLRIEQLREEQQDFFEALEIYYKSAYLGKPLED